MRYRFLLLPLLLLASPTRFSATPVSDRIASFQEFCQLLDQGQNALVTNLCRNKLSEFPGSIEVAGALLEAAHRQCRYDSALAWLETGPYAGRIPGEAVSLFLYAHRLRAQRDFEAAASKFRRAAHASLRGGDTLAAAICLRPAAQCAAGARNADLALSAALDLDRLVQCIWGADRLAVDALVIRADAFNLLDRLGEADSLYRIALDLSDRRGYRRARCDALGGLGKVSEKRQYARDAANLYGDALAEARALGATEKTAKLLNDLGQVETRLGNLERATRHLEESARLAGDCGASWLLGYVQYGLGALAEARGEMDNAKTLFRQSIEFHSEHGNRWNELGARLRLAYRQVQTGEFSAAIEQYSLCIGAYEESRSLYGLSWALSGMALAHHRLGDLQQAEEYYARALQLRRELGDKRGAAWCLNSMGMVNDLQADYRQALEYEHEALEIYEELSDRRGVGAVLFSMGSVYYYLGDFSKSLEHFEEAHAIASEEKDANLLDKAASGIGSVYEAAGRTDLAESFYLEHLELVRNGGELSGVVWSLNNVASLYVQTGEMAKARRYLDEALLLLPEQGMDYLRARALFLYAKTADSVDVAIDYTTRALELAERGGASELRWKALSDLGDYYRRRGDEQEARHWQERAIQQVEALRRGVGSDELRRHMLRPTMTPYDRMVSLIVDSHRGQESVLEAFAYTERWKAQIFAGLLREALSRIERQEDQGVNLQKDLVSQLSYVQSRLQDGKLEEDEKRRLIAKASRIERDLLQREIRLAGQRDDYASTVYLVHTDATSLLGSLRPSERMLSYFLGTEQSYLFTAKGMKIDVFVLPGRAEVEERAGRYIRLLRQLVKERQMGRSKVAAASALPPEVLETSSEELYDMLLGPVSDRLSQGETLVIVPDGILNRLPFALLKAGDDYLIDKHQLFYTPSLQSLFYLRQRADSRSGKVQADRLDVIAVGSSGSSCGNGNTKRVYPFTDIEVEPLPRAAEEARAVAAMFETSRCLTGRIATEQLFKAADLERADILHIAAHSYIDNEDVRRSFVVLTPSPNPERDTPRDTEDGLLQWQEITGLRLNAKLVTLSACKAAGGVLTYGEGITGLTQAFLYAGGSCVLASFIDVPDKFTGRFMEVFYRKLTEGMSGAAALRVAQLEAMSWTDTAHGPALWGSFSLIGDGGFGAMSH
jgi:CHAT domain-containing protein/tetratricopeptide (TPR) repeat protein